eukprot:TRINITY_DN5930_c0_g1_i2.p2 TRINITY_DN5930_c0_g1~~TRINITY_DN5930_c0_g1_i2.p2  ORF type:complete len:161 (+),score=43.20 TRINITY_DN5930_c0_g1_i2:554-1036(+)
MGEGIPKNEKRAVELYEKSASKLNENACYNLGTFYEKEGNFIKAADYYEKSSLKFKFESLTRAANLFEIGGNGLVVDLDKAARYYFLSNKPECKLDNRFNPLIAGINMDKFKKILQTKKILYQREYHLLWPNKDFLNTQILSLFLISKHRKLGSASHFFH